MADSNYFDDEAAPSTTPAEPESRAPETHDDSNYKTSTTVPKNFFGGHCKVGEIRKVKVDKILDDELIVSAVGKDKGNDKDESDDHDDDAGSEPDADEDDSGNY